MGIFITSTIWLQRVYVLCYGQNVTHLLSFKKPEIFFYKIFFFQSSEKYFFKGLKTSFSIEENVLRDLWELLCPQPNGYRGYMSFVTFKTCLIEIMVLDPRSFWTKAVARHLELSVSVRMSASLELTIILEGCIQFGATLVYRDLMIKLRWNSEIGNIEPHLLVSLSQKVNIFPENNLPSKARKNSPNIE